MGVRLEHDILFNFAASPVGAGLKRLYEYARWFDAHGGARFIIHPRCESLRREFNRNEFVIARQSSASRILRGVQAVRDVQRTIGTPDCYYAFGIPLHGRVGRVNWCHVSNVLTLAWWKQPPARGLVRTVAGAMYHALPWLALAVAYFGLRLWIFGDPFRVFPGTSPLRTLVSGEWMTNLLSLRIWWPQIMPEALPRACPARRRRPGTQR
jgi:hypothetical protein